ncbi:META domain-containing protein [Paracoccus pacificus]|uniref:META domain-containing protein n=1 Tax=Paracoccus pacificus TaxID=1463598 RepID=A0ABW4RAD9_9RHOB
MFRKAMFVPAAALVALTALAACETPGGTTANSQPAGTPYRLMTINAIPFAGNATIQFTGDNATGNGLGLAGVTPCGAWTGTRTGTLPEFHATNITSVQTACANAAAQKAFLDGLQVVNRATFTDGKLTLSNAAGTTMSFITP